MPGETGAHRARTAAGDSRRVLARERESAVLPTNDVQFALLRGELKLGAAGGFVVLEARRSAEHPNQLGRPRKSLDPPVHHHADAVGQGQHDEPGRDARKRRVADGVLHPPFDVPHVEVVKLMKPLARSAI
ncbi:MAG: hypothetical protein NTW96_12780 [Planctomycetia bacterium]|nr:hypothetical protein [Planctomycetia bacterium]